MLEGLKACIESCVPEQVPLPLMARARTPLTAVLALVPCFNSADSTAARAFAVPRWWLPSCFVASARTSSPLPRRSRALSWTRTELGASKTPPRFRTHAMFSAEATGAVVAAGLAAVSAPQPALAARASDEDDEAPKGGDFSTDLRRKGLSYPERASTSASWPCWRCHSLPFPGPSSTWLGCKIGFLPLCRSFVADARG